MAFQKTEGIILKKHNFSDYHKMVTIFTRDFGKKTVAAKGVRKLKSKLAPHLEVGMKTKITITKGKKNDILTGAQVQNAHKEIHKNLRKTSYIYILSEIVDKLTEEEHCDYDLYEIIAIGCELINEAEDRQLPMIFSAVLAHILKNHGIYPETDQCSRTGEKLVKEDAAFSFKKNGIIKRKYKLHEDQVITVNQIKYLKYLKSAEIRKCIIAGLPEGDVLFIRNLLINYTSYTLSQQIRSSQLFQKIDTMNLNI